MCRTSSARCGAWPAAGPRSTQGASRSCALAAARRLRSSYCCLAHGKVLHERFADPVRDIALDHRSAGLDAVDVAVMDLAERVVDDAAAIEDADLQLLRDLGLSDTEIMDVVLAAAAHCS